jgi:hypothetical protein
MTRQSLASFVLFPLFGALIQGCATPQVQLIPAAYTGPTATIADTATGGGSGGGVFFFVEEVNDERIVNTLGASFAASRGQGAYMQLSQVERKLIARKTKLKLAGRVGYAAPIQQMFKSNSAYSVEGVIEVDLRPDVRYRVTGVLDAFKREVWLEEGGTQQILGGKIIGAPETPAASMTDAQFTCCNLRYEGDWISDANWATLPFVPAGSRIKVVDYGRNRASVMIDGRPMRIGLDYGRAQGTTEKFVSKLLVREDPNLRIATFPANIAAAIRAGKVMPGMTHDQVIVSLGYPRADGTPSLESAGWKYWTRANEEYIVRWDSDRRVKEIDGAHGVKLRVVHAE